MLASGQLHVAARTFMPGCTGEMFEWWFRFAPDTRQYAWWHPLDHVSWQWRETSPLTHVGSTHVVQERLGDTSDEVHALQIKRLRRVTGAEDLVGVAEVHLGATLARRQHGQDPMSVKATVMQVRPALVQAPLGAPRDLHPAAQARQRRRDRRRARTRRVPLGGRHPD